MDYKNKYLKYKKKYLQLKQHNNSIKNKLQIGGSVLVSSTVLHQLKAYNTDPPKWFEPDKGALEITSNGSFGINNTGIASNYNLIGPLICIAYPKEHYTSFNDSILTSDYINGYTLTSIVLYTDQPPHYISLCLYEGSWYKFNDLYYPDIPSDYKPNSLNGWRLRILMYSKNDTGAHTLYRPMVNVPNCSNMCFINSVVQALITSYGYYKLKEKLKSVRNELVKQTLTYLEAIETSSVITSRQGVQCKDKQEHFRQYCSDDIISLDRGGLGDAVDFLDKFIEFTHLHDNQGFTYKSLDGIIETSIYRVLSDYTPQHIASTIYEKTVRNFKDNPDTYKHQFESILTKLANHIDQRNNVSDIFKILYQKDPDTRNAINSLKDSLPERIQMVLKAEAARAPGAQSNTRPIAAEEAELHENNNIPTTIDYSLLGGGVIISVIIPIIIYIYYI